MLCEAHIARPSLRQPLRRAGSRLWVGLCRAVMVARPRQALAQPVPTRLRRVLVSTGPQHLFGHACAATAMLHASMSVTSCKCSVAVNIVSHRVCCVATCMCYIHHPDCAPGYGGTSCDACDVGQVQATSGVAAGNATPCIDCADAGKTTRMKGRTTCTGKHTCTIDAQVAVKAHGARCGGRLLIKTNTSKDFLLHKITDLSWHALDPTRHFKKQVACSIFE
jgi:hypothetical protein